MHRAYGSHGILCAGGRFILRRRLGASPDLQHEPQDDGTTHEHRRSEPVVRLNKIKVPRLPRERIQQREPPSDADQQHVELIMREHPQGEQEERTPRVPPPKSRAHSPQTSSVPIGIWKSASASPAFAQNSRSGRESLKMSGSSALIITR